MSLRASLLLPPVVTGAALCAIFAGALAPPDARAAAEASIRARWDSVAERDAVANDVDAYFAAHGRDASAAWFTATARAHGLDALGILDAVIGSPAARADPAMPRRLASLLLPVVGAAPGPPGTMNALGPRALLARVDANAPGARAELERNVGAMGWGAIVAYYVPAHRADTEGRRALANALLARSSEPPFETAGATLLTGPKERRYVKRLLERFHSDWSRTRHPTWLQVTRALGASGDPEALAAIRGMREAAGEPRTLEDHSRLLALDVALALDGDAAAIERTERWVRDEKFADRATLLYAEGLQTRLTQGDAGAAARLERLHAATTSPRGRLQVVGGLVMSDALPPASLPIDAWSDDLVASPDPLDRTIGLVWKWRTRSEDVTERLLELLVTSLRSEALLSHPNGESIEGSLAIEILRAWSRWS